MTFRELLECGGSEGTIEDRASHTWTMTMLCANPDEYADMMDFAVKHDNEEIPEGLLRILAGDLDWPWGRAIRG